MGISRSGYKDILGFYTCESEGPHFWFGAMNALKARGVEDIAIACVELLKVFSQNTELQQCKSSSN